jgi:hypothetical protein
MPTQFRSAAVLVGVLGVGLLSGCSGPPSDLEGAGKAGATVTLASNTCWTGETLGADPQAILKLSTTYGVNYFDAAHALAGRPAFKLTEACGTGHHVEVYRTVAVDAVKPVATTYATLLQPSSSAYQQIAAGVEKACMGKSLVRAAGLTRLAGAVVEPAFPEGVALGWAPPSPEQWSRGQRSYACLLTSVHAAKFRYSTVFTRSFPTRLRTCIDSSALKYVDCSKKHDRERIAIIDVRYPVAAGTFPGSTAIKVGRDGRYVDLPVATLALLDKACTSYLNSVSTTKKLTGVAEVDADQWPSADGSYPIACEADVAPAKKSVVTTGSVYNQK